MSKPQEESSWKMEIRKEERKDRMEDEPSLPSDKTLIVTTLSSEWKSSKGGLTTINRELTIQLAKHPNVKVYVYLPKCTEEDKKVARSQKVQLIEAKELSGYEPIDWLASLPEGHVSHILIGHGLHLGRQMQLIKRYDHDFKWVQFVHTAPEELGMYKSYEEAISKGEEKHKAEVNLCEQADQVVAVGPKLAESYSHYLRSSEKDVINLTPGIFEEFSKFKQDPKEGKTFDVLVFGRGDGEDFNLKGYDIAVQAVAELKDLSYHLKFVGAPAGKEDEVKEKLLRHGIHKSQLTVRRLKERREDLAKLLCEVDLAIMPSRTEGFGLTALEALSAGLPVLVSGNSGLGDALKNLGPSGDSHVVDSEDPKEWAEAIKLVRQKNREDRLEEANRLRERYASEYSWQKQCANLVEAMLHLSFGVKLKIDVEVMKPTEHSTLQDKTPVSTVESGGSQNVSSGQNQSSGVNAEAPQAPMYFPTIEQVLCGIAANVMKTTAPKNWDEHDHFLTYLERIRATLTSVSTGSLLITMKCHSLQILERLWKDHLSGHLGEVIQRRFVTEEILTEFSLAELKLKTAISEEEYKACKAKLEKELSEEVGTLEIQQETNASQSIAEGQGIKEGTVGGEAQFVLTTRNAEGEQCYNEHDRVTVEIRDEQGRECATEVRINDNKDGSYKIRYSPKDQGKYKVTVKVNGEHVLDSPFSIEVKLFQLRSVLSFGKYGSSVGMFIFPWGVAVNARDEIAVTDCRNQRVQIFNSGGKYLRSFGRGGNKAGEFYDPRGITFHKNGNIFVADQHNHRIQIFSEEGEYVGMFGGYGSLDSQLFEPWGLSVDSDGNIIVADGGNKLIKIFSPDGKFLMKIGGQGSLTVPIHCVQCDRYLIVSDSRELCVKVFNYDGNFQYKFGKQGGGDGEFIYPCCLSVNKSGHLMVCDEFTNRIMVFELNGKFVGKFGTEGRNLGEFNSPRSVAVLSNGRIVVSDLGNHRIQILE